MRDTSRRRSARLLTVLVAIAALAAAIAFATRDQRSAEQRFAADPRDVASADEWLAELTEELYDAEDRGTMQAIYREGVMAARIRDLAPRLADRRSFAKLRAVYYMANEPLDPEVTALVAAAVENDAALADDPRFVALLRATCEYAAKAPTMQAVYERALRELERHAAGDR